MADTNAYVLRVYDIGSDSPKSEVRHDWPAMRRHLATIGIVDSGDHMIGPIRAAEQCTQIGPIDGVRYVLDCDWNDQ